MIASSGEPADAAKGVPNLSKTQGKAPAKSAGEGSPASSRYSVAESVLESSKIDKIFALLLFRRSRVADGFGPNTRRSRFRFLSNTKRLQFDKYLSRKLG